MTFSISARVSLRDAVEGWYGSRDDSRDFSFFQKIFTYTRIKFKKPNFKKHFLSKKKIWFLRNRPCFLTRAFISNYNLKNIVASYNQLWSCSNNNYLKNSFEEKNNFLFNHYTGNIVYMSSLLTCSGIYFRDWV